MFIARYRQRIPNALDALAISSEQIRFEYTSETVCCTGRRISDEIRERVPDAAEVFTTGTLTHE